MKIATPRPKKRRMTRANKLAATRRKLITAVTEIVGQLMGEIAAAGYETLEGQQ